MSSKAFPLHQTLTGTIDLADRLTEGGVLLLALWVGWIILAWAAPEAMTLLLRAQRRVTRRHQGYLLCGAAHAPIDSAQLIVVPDSRKTRFGRPHSPLRLASAYQWSPLRTGLWLAGRLLGNPIGLVFDTLRWPCHRQMPWRNLDDYISYSGLQLGLSIEPHPLLGRAVVRVDWEETIGTKTVAKSAHISLDKHSINRPREFRPFETFRLALKADI